MRIRDVTRNLIGPGKTSGQKILCNITFSGYDVIYVQERSIATYFAMGGSQSTQENPGRAHESNFTVEYMHS